MTNQELNEAVAKALGLTFQRRYDDELFIVCEEYGNGHAIFNPATDETAAVWALERMPGAALAMAAREVLGAFSKGRWMCAIGKTHANGSFCEAICQAIVGQ